MSEVRLKRHIAKTISYRLLSSSVGFLAIWMTTGQIYAGMAFSSFELVFKPILYFLHERAWYKFVSFGVVKEKEKKLIESEKIYLH